MKTVALGAGRSAAALSTPAEASSRLLFVDSIRVYLTMLVIAHHLMIIYAGSGGWIYYEGLQDDLTAALGGWFCAVNQAYFMGLFLFVAAYFVPGAYDRKGPVKFLVDRLIRLGIPLVVYCWVLRPLLIYLGTTARSTSFWEWYTGDYFRVYSVLGGGPLWFIEILLLFSILYAFGRLLVGSRPAAPAPTSHFPGNRVLVLFAVLVGIASFLVRLLSPVNDTFVPLNLQFANFAQYIALFIAGLLAYRRNRLANLPDSAGRLWLGIAILLILLYGPLAVLGGATENVAVFLGGWHWQALELALWESFLCLSASIGLIYLFRRRFHRQSPAGREVSRSAYAAYLIHEPIITAAAVLAAGAIVYPLLKFALAALVLIPFCFGLGSAIRRLPYANRIL